MKRKYEILIAITCLMITIGLICHHCAEPKQIETTPSVKVIYQFPSSDDDSYDEDGNYVNDNDDEDAQ